MYGTKIKFSGEIHRNRGGITENTKGSRVKIL